MKNLLNLKRTVWKQSIITQLRRSNDGQTTVKRRSRLMSIICLFLLTLGVGQMWAGTNGNNIAFNNCHFYFNPYYDATHTVNKGYIQLSARKYQFSGGDDYGWWTATTTLSNVANTRLYYASTLEGTAWGDKDKRFHGWAIISNSDKKAASASDEWWNSSTWASDFKDYGLNSNDTYLFQASSSTKGQTIETTSAPGYLSSGWSGLNKTITVKAKVSTNNGSSYTETTSPATLSASSKKFTAHNTCTTTTSLSSGTITCGYTATTTLTAPSTDPTGYKFDGWYNSSGTRQTTSKTLTIYPTGNATYYAYYRKLYTIAASSTVVWDLCGNEKSWSAAYLYTDIEGGSTSSTALTQCGTTTQYAKSYASALNNIKVFLFRGQNGSTWSDYMQTPDYYENVSGVTLYTFNNSYDGKKLQATKTTNAKKATSGIKVYFDKTAGWDGEIWLKYGTSIYNRHTGTAASKVTGTENLYVITIPNDCYYEKYVLADNYGYTGRNNITADNNISHRIAHQTTNIDSEITYIPTTGTGSGTAGSPKVWSFNTINGGHKRTLTFGDHENGNITVRYTDESGVEQTVSSASASYVDVAQTCKVIITAVPNSGFAPSTLTLGGASITSGAQQIIRANGEIAATFVAEETHNVTVSYKYGSRALHDNQVFEVGVTTPASINAEEIDGFQFSAWSDLTNVTNNTGNLTTDPISINTIVSGSNGSMTCNYTPWTCSLDIVPSEGATGHSSRMAMSYDATEKAYYINRTTASATERYRFFINSIEYSTSGNTELTIDETKVNANTPVTNYATNKPSVYFNDGPSGSNITIWFDYENKKAWVTEQKHTVTISAGSHGSVSPTSVSAGAIKASPTITATADEHYHWESWTLPNSGVTIASGSGTKTITINATEDSKIVTANFAGDQYTITYMDQGDVAYSGSNRASLPATHTYGTATALVDGYKAGYTFGGWYTDASCTSAAVSSIGATTKTANFTLYAKWTENLTTVTLASTTGGHIEIGGENVTSTTTGVYTTRSLTPVADAGYYFAGWTKTACTDYSITGAENSEDNTTITLTGLGTGATSGEILTANFVELDKIYFRNENEETGGKLWDVSKMYVYYNVGWANDGVYAGVNNLGTNAEMNPISAESNIYWAYVPRSFTTSGNRNVAFSDKWMGTEDYPGGTYTKFYQNEAVYRTDYNTNLNMYVPEHTEKYTSNSTKYFDNGYWMKYNTVTNQDAGYYLKEGNKDNQVDIFVAAGNNSTTLIARYRFENTSNHTFFIANAAGKFYKASAAITNAACTNVTIVEDAATPVGFTITPTSEGYYTLYIEQSGEKMKLSVVYPISAGDYRLDYTHDTDKHLYSDVFKPDDASSTNVKKSVYIDPATTGGSLKLQKCSGLDGSANPVWTSGRDIALDNFKDGKGVYEFDMTITDGTAVDADVASVALSNVKIYEGPFYIKTDYAPGHWVNYKENVLNKNTINFDAANPQSYNYYHCAWVGEGDMNVKCIIANDYNEQITDTLKTDDIVTGTPEVLPATANVRFSYNSVTNTLKRTYLNGSANWEDRFLLLAGDEKIRSFKTHAAYAGNDTTMVDNNNWTYVLDLEAKGGAEVKLSANYHNTTQWLIGDATHTVQILGGTDTDWASLRIVYDFKTNHLLSAWLVPASGNTPAKTLNTSVMVLRENQDDAREITFANESHALSAVDTVYSALHFTYDYLTNQGGATKTVHERTFYWISFPYDVKVSDIFGSVGNYMEEWGILYYDGKQRAKNGMWIDSPSCWKYMAADDMLHAFEGYVAEIDLALIGTERNKGRWINNVTDLCLYFPSNGKVNSIVSQNITISIDQTDYLCKIDRTGNNGSDFNKNRTIADSYWHCLGVPSFAKNTHSTSTDWTGNYPTLTNWETDHMPYVYEYDGTTNSYTVVSAANYEFKPMRSYLTQFNATSLTWSSVTAPATPSSVAARRAPQGAETDTEFRLTLMQDAQEIDRTFVRLCDDENVTAGFEFNYDLCKEMKTGANVYTIVSNYLPVAGNCLPMNNQTTIVPVGVKIMANGEYTFAMPEGTNGTGVTLIDNETGTRTNLSLMDYTVALNKGDYRDRFYLEISPIKNVPTGIEEVPSDQVLSTKARKTIVDGIMYILRDGQIYDARGNKVK